MIHRGTDDRGVLAQEIAKYLAETGTMADTADGIAQWWLTQQRVQEGRKKVEEALDYLVAQGLVTRRVLPDGKVLYTKAKH